MLKNKEKKCEIALSERITHKKKYS